MRFDRKHKSQIQLFSSLLTAAAGIPPLRCIRMKETDNGRGSIAAPPIVGTLFVKY
jgi:hypothetical protein